MRLTLHSHRLGAMRRLCLLGGLAACAAEAPGVPEESLPAYRVLADSGYETPGKLQADRYLLVEGAVDSAGLHRLAALHLDSLLERGPGRWHDHPTVAAVFVYDSEEKALAGQGQYIARAILTPARSSPEIDVRGSVLTARATPVPTIGGLPEARLQESWVALVRAQDRATREAERRHPDLDPLSPSYSPEAARAQFLRQGELRNQLSARYEAQARKQFGLTEAQFDSVSALAFERQWALPAP